MTSLRTSAAEFCFSPSVAVAEVPSCSYPKGTEPVNAVSRALLRAARALEWENDRGPFGNVIPPGSRVVIKPNLVLHRNEGPGGMDPLITHPTLIRAAVEAALEAGPSEVIVGDAPIQSCDFEALLRDTGLQDWSRDLQRRDSRFRGIRDFRRTTCVLVGGGLRIATEKLQPMEQFVLFDLGAQSLLDSITGDEAPFRVTWYDPRLMAKTHRRGRHQYLVARDIIDADVVINLPKLKTHRKAGVTCALKNLIGINGNKEYLPHHRMGGAGEGGDCYPGTSTVKRTLERVADRQNVTASRVEGVLWWGVTFLLNRVLRMRKDRLGVDGSWAGNDTIWRTCLDLNRILLYGRSDATLAGTPQRRVVHLVDAVVAGQGNGPLAPDPLSMGLILAGQNAAAVDWVGSLLLQYDPEKIPITREAFGRFRWPLTVADPSKVHIVGDLGSGPADKILAYPARGGKISHPSGWVTAAIAEREEAVV